MSSLSLSCSLQLSMFSSLRQIAKPSGHGRHLVQPLNSFQHGCPLLLPKMLLCDDTLFYVFLWLPPLSPESILHSQSTFQGWSSLGFFPQRLFSHSTLFLSGVVSWHSANAVCMCQIKLWLFLKRWLWCLTCTSDIVIWNGTLDHSPDLLPRKCSLSFISVSRASVAPNPVEQLFSCPLPTPPLHLRVAQALLHLSEEAWIPFHKPVVLK